MARWQIITGDCRLMTARFSGQFDLLILDPPYGDTSLNWDERVGGIFELCRLLLRPEGSFWLFGSMRYCLDHGPEISKAGFRYAQDIVWEKQNGSGFHADRFKRVHEHAVQFYRQEAKWGDVFNDVQKTNDAVAKTARRKKRPPHMGAIERGHFLSQDGGPRLMRSVIQMANCHGRAIHPTEKPDALMEILIRTSCPPEGVIGDLFCGSGSAGEAAVRSSRLYVGCEIDPVMAQKARDRISAILPL